MAKSSKKEEGVLTSVAAMFGAAKSEEAAVDAELDSVAKSETETTEAVVGTAGVFRLSPISGSLDRRTIDVDVELSGDDGALRLGDVRAAAEKATAADQHEVAHRIWTVLIEAARRVKNVPLEALSVSRADAAKLQAKKAGRGGSPAPIARGSYAYDYEALAADRADGNSQADVAKEWGCSPGTVARAVRYVNERDQLVNEHPDMLDDVFDGATVDELAEKYGSSTKVMRWIVTTSLDRRSS